VTTGHTEPAAPAGAVDGPPVDVTVREAVSVPELLGASPVVRRAGWDDLTPRLAHALARLRVDVLVAEADRPGRELDDEDLLADTEHLWIEDGDTAVAYLRIVRAGDGVRVVDRLCARADVRRLGLTGELLGDVVARYGAGPLRAAAQQDAVPLFGRQTFEVSGRPAAGPHGRTVPMVRHPEAPWRC
jgi:ElaA protein